MRDLLRKRAVRTSLTVVVTVALLAIILFLGHKKHFGLRQYAQLTLDGIRGGSIYALIALGFVVIYNVTGIINFAQGAFVMLGAMVCVTFYNVDVAMAPAPKLLLAFILSVICVAIIGGLLERLAIHPARHSPILTLIMITVGAYIAIQGIALLIWGADPYSLPAFSTLALGDKRFRFAGILVKGQSFWIWGTTAVILAALAFFFERTILGKAVRACAVNSKAAQLMGISPSRMSLLSFSLAAALGAIGGIVLAPATRPIYDMGLRLGLKGFVAAIMGGMVSSTGAVIGGLLLGVLENVGAGVTKAGFKDIIAFVILILILLFRPQGIIGGGEKGVEE